eukprot:3219504-Rhodomonas_salina.1
MTENMIKRYLEEENNGVEEVNTVTEAEERTTAHPVKGTPMTADGTDQRGPQNGSAGQGGQSATGNLTAMVLEGNGVAGAVSKDGNGPQGQDPNSGGMGGAGSSLLPPQQETGGAAAALLPRIGIGRAAAKSGQEERGMGGRMGRSSRELPAPYKVALLQGRGRGSPAVINLMAAGRAALGLN